MALQDGMVSKEAQILANLIMRYVYGANWTADVFASQVHVNLLSALPGLTALYMMDQTVYKCLITVLETCPD